jgi:predicted alpha/beta-hydrolase family hydrolase
MLFVQGSRDPFGTADEIRALLPRLPHAEVHEVAGGDHSFKVTGKSVRQDEVIAGVLDGVAEWMKS